ncbi:MAG: glycosyltransferase [Candidatus Roizmanbacteria bacterium]|nr:glycosyltransferase [Candidatus Roizmanbacteria bacterium]
MIKNLTVLIITRNAADTLVRTLESVKNMTSEIVIIDDYSTDYTVEIAQQFKCRVVRHHCYDFGLQRAFALSQVTTEWTFVLDSDEVITNKNKEEIAQALSNPKYDGYRLHFRNHLFGKKLMHGELHKKLVLFKTTSATSGEMLIHEQYKVKGVIGELKSEVSHYSYRSFPQIIKKFFDYSVRQAKEYKNAKRKYGLKELFLHPLHMFYARAIKDQGYKDGFARIMLDALFAKMEFFSYALIPWVKGKQRVGVDCGSYVVGEGVKSGIDRVIQGINSGKDSSVDYYWFGFNNASLHRLPTRLYSQLWLPLAILIHRCDVFLGTGGTIPWLLQFFPVKKIMFLYDFGFFSSPENYKHSASKLQFQTEQSIRISDTIIILHNEIYKEFEKRYPNFVYKVQVIPSGADHLQSVAEKPVFIQPKKPIALFVGVVKPVKRIDKLLSVVGDTYTVIAGPQEAEYVKSLHIGKTQNVQFIQNFNDGQLKWLYKNADVMMYTSQHEGFCYPVLEALIEGLPVIALDLPIFQEYKKYFPHLTLVPNEEKLNEALLKHNVKKAEKSISHPYKWEIFNENLLGVMNNQPWQPSYLPAGRQGLTETKIALIVVLYKTLQEEKARLEEEIKTIFSSGHLDSTNYVKSFTIYWIDNSTNGKGYAAGVNEGIRAGLEDGCDYFFALNPDISLKGISVKSLFAASKLFDIWGYVMKQGKSIFYGGEIDKWRLSGGLISQKPAHRFTQVDFISGSVMGFSKKVVQTIGLWDESYFMYYEDVDYCVRARNAGFVVGIDSEVTYDHFEVSQLNKKKEKWIAKSRWKFFWKYANVGQKIREVMRLPKTLLNK